jgi:hypothetical protein
MLENKTTLEMLDLKRRNIEPDEEINQYNIR